MSKNATQIVDDMITQLRLEDPDISGEIGTPERKLIEAVAEQIALGYVDLDVLSQQHNVDLMSGNRLDIFLSLFTFGRKAPTRATGIATFSRLSEAEVDIVIPRGTQVMAKQTDPSFPVLVYVTTTTVTLSKGTLNVQSSIECTLPGSVGNVPAASVTTFVGIVAISGITSVTNAQGITGGIDGETDADFRLRFKNTVFRNVSGTTDQFLALGVSSPFVSKANAVGPLSRYQEYMQVPQADDTTKVTPYDPTGTVYPTKRTTHTSTIPYSKWTYDFNVYLTSDAFDSEATFFTPFNDYVFNNPALVGAGHGDGTSDTAAPANHQPNITILQPDITIPSITEGSPTVLLLEHAYMSRNSRNDYILQVLNCVDLFVDGSEPTSVSSAEVFPDATVMAFQNFNDHLNTFYANYVRAIDGLRPAYGNLTGSILQILYWQPLIDLPNTINIDDTQFYKARFKYDYDGGGIRYWYYDPTITDQADNFEASYFLVKDITNLAGTVRARNGIEWAAVQGQLISGGGVGSYPADKTGIEFTVSSYTYDKNIEDLQVLCERHKQVTTDVLVHQAKIRYFRLNITIIYSPGSTASAVNNLIVSALDSFFHSSYFGTAIQLSDLLQTVHNVPGVDNVRWTDVDHISGKLLRVEEVQQNGDSFADRLAHTFQDDFYLEDSELPAVPDTQGGTNITAALVIRRRVPNTWTT